MATKWEEPSGTIERAKIKRKRKPMSEEQRLAASERLRKAREARGPAKNLSLPENIRNLDKDHYLHPDKVKEWIKVWKAKISGMKYWKDSKDKNQRQEYQTAETYIKNMQSYLTTGTWCDFWYGENREHQIVWKVIANAYEFNGEIKRTKGHFYTDVGFYGREEEDES